MNKKWNLTRKITRKTPDGTITEVTEIGEPVNAKLRFLNMMIKAQRTIDNMREGRMTKVSVVLLNREFGRLRSELETANAKLASLGYENHDTP